MPGSDAGSGSILLSAFPPPPNGQSPLKKQYSIHPHPTHSRSRPHAQPRPRQPILLSRAQSLPGIPAADDKLHLTTRPFTAGAHAHAHAQAVTSPSARSSIRAPSVRSMSMSIRPQANHNRGRSRTMRPPPITPAEFERLPPTLQRKYFSTFERLKIAQQTTLPSDLRSSQAPSKSFESARSPPRAKKQRTVRNDQASLQANAEFFLSLPDKIRRQQFSVQEQAQISAFLDIAAAELPELRQKSNRSSIGVQAASASNSKRSSYCHTAAGALALTTGELAQAPPQTRLPVFQLAPVPTNKLRRLASKRRNNSLPRLPVMPRSSPCPTAPVSPVAARHNRSQSVGPRPLRSSNDSSIRIIETQEAVYYQDPEARMKLRNYLASPQKFDEAVEFGFPATTPTIVESEPPAPKPVRSTSTNDAHRFLTHDTISFIDAMDEAPELAHDEDGLSSAPESPTTPMEMEGAVTPYAGSIAGRSLFSPLDATSLPVLDLLTFTPPTSANKVKAQDAFETMINREMTLRMTLTRPDLRAPEDLLYGWQHSSEAQATAGAVATADPLALADLPLSDDITGSAGPFATNDRRNPGAFRRFFHGLARRH